MIIALVPVFNEEKHIIEFLNELDKQVDFMFIVNDGSFDKTDQLVTSWLKDKKNKWYICSFSNKGMAQALLAGFRYINDVFATGRFNQNDVVVTIDADGQHEPSEIKKMCVYFKDNDLDFLITKRDFSKYPFYRILGNKLISNFNSLITGYSFKDIESGFKMFRISLICELLKYYVGFRYSCASEMGVIAGLLKYKINNTYPTKVLYYRKRSGCPTILDFFINTILPFWVALKIRFGKKA